MVGVGGGRDRASVFPTQSLHPGLLQVGEASQALAAEGEQLHGGNAATGIPLRGGRRGRCRGCGRCRRR